MGSTFVYERAVKFDDCDPAGIVFFANHFRFCHEAMEAFFDQLPIRYAGLIVVRKTGFPAVQAHAEYKAPLAYGDTATIAVTLEHVGNASAQFHYEIVRARDATVAAICRTTCVHTDLTTYASKPLPDDLRAHLEAHRRDARPA